MTHRYKVLAAAESTGIVAVLDADGRCHIGRALGKVPSPNVDLRGEPPAIGVRSLLVEQDEEPCPVALVMLDCEPEVAAKLATPINMI